MTSTGCDRGYSLKVVGVAVSVTPDAAEDTADAVTDSCRQNSADTQTQHTMNIAAHHNT